MSDTQEGKLESKRFKVTAYITQRAYEAITDIQRQHRRKTGKHLRLWQALDSAVTAYAETLGIKV